MMKKINEFLFLSKLNEASSNNLRKFYCYLIDTQTNFDSEYKIEKLYFMCKIYYENNSLLQTIDISNTVISYIKYFIENLNYIPLPKTIFYLNSVILMTMKLLIDSNLLSNIVILYSKYLNIIKNKNIKEIIKSNKSVKYTKKKVIDLFQEAKNRFQEQLNTRKEYFSILNSDSTSFQEKLKKEISTFINGLEEEIRKIIENEEENEFPVIDKKNKKGKNTIYYVISIDWLHKFLEFKKFLDDIMENVENYKYFLFTGFDADNVIINIINNYNNIKNNIISYIGPIINENCLLCQGVMKDPNYENNNYMLTNGYAFINENLYNKLSDFFGIDFEIKRERKNFHIKFLEIMILNKSLLKIDISSICKENISLEKNISYEELKQKIIRCLKHKYNIDCSNNIINIYIYEYKDINDKEFINNQNFQILLAYGFQLVDKLCIKAEKINSDNIIQFLNNENFFNDSFIYIEILDDKEEIPFLCLENENICNFCNNKIKNNKNIINCDENEKCLNMYCSNECKLKDKKHINFHNELSKYFIQQISLEQLLDEEISFPKNSNLGLTGLINIGNSCFMNSALQCLSNCFQLTKYFLSDLYLNEINTENELGTQGKIVKAYTNLLKQLWKGEDEYIYPDEFRDIFIQYEGQFSGYGQHDSNEFLIFLLDKLHEDLNRISSKKYKEIKEKKETEDDEQAALRWWKCHLKRENSIIVNLFHGQYKNKVVCCECGKISITYDPFMFLSLPIPSGRYNYKIKYFGYTPGDFHEFVISLNERTTTDDIEKSILEELSIIFEDKKNDKKRNGRNIVKKRRLSKKKNRGENINENYNENNKEENINSVELIVLTKDKKIFKILNKSDIAFDYITKGYEIVAYEKEIISDLSPNKQENGNYSENIYFYLVLFVNENFLWLYPYIYEKKLFKYPLPITIKSEQTIFHIYEKIYIYIRHLKLSHYFQKEEFLNLNDTFYNISYRNEKSTGFLIYINPNKEKKTNLSICTKIYNYFQKSESYFRILEKFSGHTKYTNIKEKLAINKNKRLILNIDLKCDIDINKLPKVEEDNKLVCNSKIDFYDCLKLFNSEEIIDNEFFCTKCRKKVSIHKKMDIYKEPYYLIIHFKRFKNRIEETNNYFSKFFNNIKNNAFIAFPIQNLDLTEYVLRNKDNNKKIKYNLIGIINHYGSAYYGHYTANCLNRNNWYKFNDEIVSKMKENKIVTDSAYVLFYQRINQ